MAEDKELPQERIRWIKDFRCVSRAIMISLHKWFRNELSCCPPTIPESICILQYLHEKLVDSSNAPTDRTEEILSLMVQKPDISVYFKMLVSHRVNMKLCFDLWKATLGTQIKDENFVKSLANRVTVHDFSKLHPYEILGFYYKNVLKREDMIAKELFSYSRYHHFMTNDHHTEFYTNYTQEERSHIMTDLAFVESVLDKMAHRLERSLTKGQITTEELFSIPTTDITYSYEGKYKSKFQTYLLNWSSCLKSQLNDRKVENDKFPLLNNWEKQSGFHLYVKTT